VTHAGVGPLVKGWRTRRRRSQLDLALDVGVSCRHLSFVETGRSRPSPELVLAIAEHLDVPLRERNHLLLAAGYAPRFTERPLDHPSMAAVRQSVQRVLDAHLPYPGIVLDRQWNVVLANTAALALTRGVPDHLLGPPLNVYRLSLHPEGLWGRSTNPEEWGAYLLWQLERSLALTADAGLQAVHDELSAYPNVAQLGRQGRASLEESPILVPFRFPTPDGGVLSMFTTLTTFGTPRDITLDELAVELFYPADDASAALLRAAMSPQS
jgi:transcriptional regulator with XRE-family HTH domain